MKITRLTVLRPTEQESVSLTPLLDDVPYADDKSTTVGLNGLSYADATTDMLVAAQRVGKQTITSAMVDEVVRKIKREEPDFASVLKQKELRAAAKDRLISVVPVTSRDDTVVILNIDGESHTTTYAIGLNLNDADTKAVLNTLNWGFQPAWLNLSMCANRVLHRIAADPENEMLADDISIVPSSVWEGVHSGMKLSTSGLRPTAAHIKSAVCDDDILCMAAAVMNDACHTISLKDGAKMVGVSLDVDDGFYMRDEASMEIYRHALRTVCATLDKLTNGD